MKKRTRYEELFVRYKKNPILTAEMWPYPAHTVFNAGATRLKDGTTLLLCRVEDRTGRSHLTAARSHNGVDGWVIDPEPTLMPDREGHPEEFWGIEDPRVVYVDELKKYVVTYTAFGKAGPGVALCTTEDFKTFERFGLVMQPDDKDATLLPHRIGGNFVMVHRPVHMSEWGAHIWMSDSPDLRNWGNHRLILRARKGGWWDANKIGLSPPLIETSQGWLMLYHGVRTSCAGSLYRLGLALFDKHRPDECIRRGDEWIMGPETPYEKTGDVDNVAFPCGFTIGDDHDTINLYYGGADTCMALAHGSIKQLLHWLEVHGQPPEKLSP